MFETVTALRAFGYQSDVENRPVGPNTRNDTHFQFDLDDVSPAEKAQLVSALEEETAVIPQAQDCPKAVSATI
ncbi:hypothetical protein [Halostella sp. PRR32]|uniref:hypothetical protein n=1 Tax=Halostella sp. PRR32 TaxID=3098147 RepID=UPI002B1CF255|nr:hypothetical protein [Halostella sp. PRR32]